MSDSPSALAPSASQGSERRRTSRTLAHRAIILLVALVAAALLASSDAVHGWIVALLAAATPVMVRHSVFGAIIFVALAALSAMLVFFSSVLLVPIGVQAWGEPGCFLLLWVGWVLGGVITYSIGRWFARAGAGRVLSTKKFQRYAAYLPREHSFAAAVLIQIVLPSDVSGYFFGLVGFPARTYFSALAVAELPYALVTVFLGVAFVQRQYAVLLSLAGFAVMFIALLWFRRHRWPA